MMKLGLLRLSALGDVILWSALIEQCTRYYPEVQLTWVTHPIFAQLFPNLNINWVLIDKPKQLKDYWHLREKFRAEFFDVFLCGQASLRANLIYPFVPAKHKIGFDRLRGREGHHWFVDETIDYQDNHLIEGFAQFFETAGLKLNLQDLHWPIQPNQEALDFALKQLPQHPKKLGIVVAASKVERTWPLKHQVAFVKQICDHFEDKEGTIVLLGSSSPTETLIARQILEQVPQAKARTINLVGQTNLQQLAAIISKLDCIICPDTGPAHLAQAVRTPVIGLYAVARAELSGPYGSPNTINAYKRAAKHCGFSYNELRWHQRIHHPEAMCVIEPQEVLTKALSILNAAGEQKTN